MNVEPPMKEPVITRTIANPWRSVEPTWIGWLPAGVGTPDRYVICEVEGAGRIPFASGFRAVGGRG